MIVRSGAADAEVLLQHRAAWTSDGDTWGVPGGARDSHETPVQAALREAAEEAGVVAADVAVTGLWHDDHDGWMYVTVVASALAEIMLEPNAESAELRWVGLDEVDNLHLHSGFAKSWPRVRATHLA